MSTSRNALKLTNAMRKYKETTGQDYVEIIPDKYLCQYITLELMDDPVLVNGKHIYERSALEASNQGKAPVNPAAGQEPLIKAEPQPDLKKEIDDFVTNEVLAIELACELHIQEQAEKTAKEKREKDDANMAHDMHKQDEIQLKLSEKQEETDFDVAKQTLLDTIKEQRESEFKETKSFLINELRSQGKHPSEIVEIIKTASPVESRTESQLKLMNSLPFCMFSPRRSRHNANTVSENNNADDRGKRPGFKSGNSMDDTD